MPIDESPRGDAWTLLAITVAAHEAELMCDALMQMGAVAVEEQVSESGDIVLRTSLGEDGLLRVTSAAERFGSATIDVEDVPRSVVDTWREHAISSKVDEGLWLVPAWLEPPGEGTGVLIEPFDTFGLGNHPSTILALRLARRHTPRGSRLHDHGTGSGVIAVAMSLTHGCVASVDDIHPGSRAAVEHNAALNKVTAPRWHTDLPRDGVDVIVANILAPVLRAHAPLMEAAVSPGGAIVLSGLRTEQVSDVVEHYSSCDPIDRDDEDGWSAVVLRRR